MYVDTVAPQYPRPTNAKRTDRNQAIKQAYQNGETLEHRLLNTAFNPRRNFIQQIATFGAEAVGWNRYSRAITLRFVGVVEMRVSQEPVLEHGSHFRLI